eukprot:gene9939-13370_t
MVLFYFICQIFISSVISYSSHSTYVNNYSKIQTNIFDGATRDWFFLKPPYRLQSFAKDSFDLSNDILTTNKLNHVNKNPIGNNDNISSSLISSSSREEWIARATLITVSAFYGTNFACVKILGEALDPGLASTLRFIIATLLFSPNLIKVIKTNPELIKGGLEVGAYSALGYWAQAISLQTSHAGTAAFICSLAVIVVPVLDVLFNRNDSKDRNIWMSLFPAVLAACGVGCLELGGNELPGIGDLWAFLQPLFFGLGFWRIERMMKICTKPGEAQAFTGAMMLVVAVFSIIWTSHDFIFPLLTNPDKYASLSIIKSQLNAFNQWQVPAAILWTGIVTTALTSYGENIAMRKLSAAESTVIYSTEPLWGTAFAAFTLGEHIGWNTFVGATLILSACLFSSLGAKLVGLLSATEISIGAEGLEEVSENIGINVSELVSKIQEIPPTVSDM